MLSFKKYKNLLNLITFIGLISASCTSRKNLVYFQGNIPTSEINKNYTPVLRTDDLLSITVMGLDPEAVKPFNMQILNYNANLGGYASGTPSPPGYLIDAEGMVEFPVIGKIKIGGLDRMKATELIKEKLSSYVKDPSVTIRILNYKVTVLGEVRNPGTFTIPNERVTLLEAIGIAGDLQITALRKNVLVIREENGTRTETIIDLTSKNIFSSPVYYLHQNDVIYVQPNRAKINSSVVNTSNISLVVSVISLLVTMAVLFTR